MIILIKTPLETHVVALTLRLSRLTPRSQHAHAQGEHSLTVVVRHRPSIQGKRSEHTDTPPKLLASSLKLARLAIKFHEISCFVSVSSLLARIRPQY
jgi:hypothetical protein